MVRRDDTDAPGRRRRPAADADAARESPATSATSFAAGASSTSLYVHVPFCVVKCGYCDFTSYVIDDMAEHDRFLAALAVELETTHVPRSPSTVFVGGGTPSHLSAERLERLFSILRGHVDLAGCVEVTMEANPESIDERKAAIALAAGVNRFSMGAQSFDAAALRFLDRAHDAQRTRKAFAELRAAGAANVSIDLIFGLPGQELAAWQRDLEEALALGPDHLSCYSLTFEPGTRLQRDLRQGRVQRIDEDSDRAMFEWTRERLAAAGFRAYEISNFAGPGGPCRHNDHYWLQGDYVGVGPGASSHRRGCRSTNLKALEAWASAALARTPPVATAETLPPHQRIGEAIWLGLRRTEGIDLDTIAHDIGCQAGSDVEASIAAHQAAGLLERLGSRIRLTDAGLLVADAVGIEYLAAERDLIAQTPSDRR